MHSTQPPRSLRKLLIWLGVCAGVVLLILTPLAVWFVAWVTANGAKANPIPGVVINVDTGSAVFGKSIDNATRWFLQRRLRECGHGGPDQIPLRIDVAYKKIGDTQYLQGGKPVKVDRVQLQIAFLNSQGKRVFYRTYEPQFYSSENVKQSARIELNELVYNRAVDEIRKMSFPTPSELKKN